MERLIDKFLTSLLMMAERITGKSPSPADEPTTYEIRFKVNTILPLSGGAFC